MPLRTARRPFALALLLGLLALAAVLLTARSASAEPSRGEEVAIGAGVFAAGWVAGALPAVPSEDDRTHHLEAPSAESRTALVPLVGPLLWWGKVYKRVDAQADYEKAHPCKGTGEPFSCFMADTASIDRFFHVTLALPWMVAATGAQVAGVGLVVHGATRGDARPRGARVVVSPTAQGVLVSGTF